MAVTVVKREPPPEVLKEVVCRQCGCTLQYVPIDEVDGKRSCMGEVWSVKYIVCPECKSSVITKDPA